MSENMNQWQDWIGSCVLMHENGKCAVEVRFQCSPDDMSCPFHLTAEQKAQSEEARNKRMNELPEESQKHIAETYFKGKMPWRNADGSE